MASQKIPRSDPWRQYWHKLKMWQKGYRKEKPQMPVAPSMEE